MTTSRRVLQLAVIILTQFVALDAAWATPPSGFSATTLASGKLDAFVVTNQASPTNQAAPPAAGATSPAPDASKSPAPDGAKTSAPAAAKAPALDAWISAQRTEGPSDLYVQSNVWEPGGTTGWHTHPGHSLITVTAGMVTVYEGDDPTCTPHLYTVGMAFVDKGGGHAHVIRNEGPVEARTTAVQLVPAGGTRRVDAPKPAACRVQ